MNDTTKRFPRTLSDAFPDERFPAIRHYQKQSSWPIIAILCVLTLVLSIGIIRQGINAHQEAVAVEEARLEAIKQDQEERRKQAALQEMCGGPESTPVHLGRGIYECVNKRGFKQRVK